MKSSELSNSENGIARRQVLQNRKLRHWWRHNLGSRWKLQKMAQENFSIRALYNITKNHDNSIKTVGRDSFLSPKTPKNTNFLGVTEPPESHSPYILVDTTRPRRVTCVLVWSKSDRTRLRKTPHKQTDIQTNRQTTNRHYENNGHLAVNQWLSWEITDQMSCILNICDRLFVELWDWSGCCIVNYHISQ